MPGGKNTRQNEEMENEKTISMMEITECLQTLKTF